MTAVENLVEETGKLYGYSFKSLEEGLKELSDIEITIQALIDVALNLQEQLSSLIILRIESALPLDEEKNETRTSKDDDAHSIWHINDYTINLGPVSVFSFAEVIKEILTTFDAQKSGIAEIYSSSVFLERPQSIIPDSIESLATISKESVSKETLQKKVSIENNTPKPVFEQKLSRVDKPVFSETENLYTYLEKSALIITELKTVCDDMANISVERNNLISEENSIFNLSTDLFGEVKKEIENIQKSEVFDIELFPENVHFLSEIIRKTSKPLYTEMSEAYEITDISSLYNILARTSQSDGLINEEQPAYSSRETIKDTRILDFSETLDTISKTFNQSISQVYDITEISSLNNILAGAPEPIGLIEDKSPDAFSSQNAINSSHRFSDFPAAIDSISKTLHQNILKTHEITNISALNTISNRDSQLAEIKTDKQEHIIHSDQGIFEIPSLRPRGKISTSSDDAIANAARLSNAFAMKSREKETISTSREPISFPNATYATSSESVSEPSIYVSNAFEKISAYIMTATKIDRQMSGMMGKEAHDVNGILGQSNPLNQILSEEGSVAFNFHKIAIENGGIAKGGQMMNIALNTTEALERARSSVLHNLGVTFPLEGDYRMPSPSMMPHTIENVLQMVSGSQRDLGEGHTGNKSVNVQNMFNIVVNVKNGQKETELRDLGRKIGQVLSDEIRRYGGIQ